MGRLSRREKIGTLFLMVFMIYLSMSSRTMFAPLIPYLSRDVGLTLSQAGLLFMVITAGYATGMLLSGFAAARLEHRGTIVLALLLVATGMVMTAALAGWPWILAAALLVGFGTGIYPPSAIGLVKGMFSESARGKALAVHELGPSLSFVTSPPLVVAAEKLGNWRILPLVLAVLLVLALFAFIAWTRIGRERGAAPRFDTLKPILRDPGTWLGMALFAAAFGGGQAVFSFLPAYLTLAKGYDINEVNMLVGASRVMGVASVAVSGLLVDRLGSRRTIGLVIGFSSICTVLLGFMDGFPLKVTAFVQPALLTAFFPAGLMAVSKIGPTGAENVTFSVVITGAMLAGNGLAPLALGLLGDMGLGGPGFIVLGLAMGGTLVMLRARPGFGRQAGLPIESREEK
jgi:predicted MFS family arabinose efflux permease